MKRNIIVFLTACLISSALLGQSVVKTGEPYRVSPENAGYFMSPKWSPDGSKLMVSSQNYIGIYLIDFPNGTLTALCEEPSAGYGASWSADGKWIAARVAIFENRRRSNALAVFSTETKERQQITPYQTSMPGTPEWTADGNFLYLNNSDNLHIYQVATDSDRSLSEELVYVRNDRIYKHDPQSKSSKVLDIVPDRILNLRYSPDRKKVVFEAIGGPLYIMDVESQELTNLGIGYNPSWSPDGKYVCYMVTEDDGHQYTKSDIYVSSADGRERINVTATEAKLEMNPSWSPDGKWIAYDLPDMGAVFVQEIRYQ